jgi:hypothetical protein
MAKGNQPYVTSTAARPLASVGKSATVEKPAIRSRDASNIRNSNSSRNSQLEH